MARWLKILLGIVLLLIVALAALPWWLGAALRPAGRNFGLQFERYERIGYGRFALHHAKFEREGVLFTAHRAEVDTPLRFLISGTQTRAVLEGWRVVVTPKDSPPPPAADQPGSVPAVHRQVRDVLALLRQRLPSATARDGVIVVDDRSIEIHEAEWNGSSLRASGRLLSEHPFVAGLATRGEALVLALQLPAQGAMTELRWSETQLAGHGTWWDQPFEIDATFGEQGWLPRNAVFHARDWDLPATRARLGEQFERLRGSAELRWQDGAFRLSARAEANPRAGQQVPPLRATAEASGTTEWFTISALDVKAPFADVTLTAPLEMSYRGEMRSPPARLLVAADLGAQPWFAADGQLSGRVELAGAGPDSRGDFVLEVQGFEAGGYRAQAAQLRGDWQWPRIELTEFSAQLDAASTLRGRGALDWERRELAGVAIEGSLGRDWLARPLPANLTWHELTFSATAEGQLEAPRHAGTLHATGVKLDAVAPFEARAEWRGQERALEMLQVAAESRDSRLEIAGRLDEKRLIVRELLLAAGGAEPLRLTKPAEISWQPHLRVAGLHLQGGPTRLALDGALGPEMNYAFELTSLDAAWVRRWIEFGGPAWRVNALRSEGRAERGVLTYRITLDGAVQIDDETAQIQFAAAGDRDGLHLERLNASALDRALTRAGGRLPIVIATAPRIQARLNERAPLEFDASVAANSPLWTLLAEVAGVDATGASAEAVLRGSVIDPRGELRVNAPKIVATTGPLAGKLPQLTDLTIAAHGDRGEVTVDTLAVRIEGQPLTGSARIPMGDEAWAQLRQAPGEFAWQRAEAQLELVDADATTLTRSLDNAPLTHGRVTARTRFAGGAVVGTIEFEQLATKPLPAFGVIQDMEGRLALHDRVATIERFQARIGGEPARVTGTVTLADDNTLRLDVKAAGRNLPLVRRPGLLVRTDFDLEARTLASGLTHLGGTIQLRDTLVMADLAAILPGGPRGTARRPPYFSVAAEPFASWPIDIAVRGNQAVRVRTAVFDGVATPRFQLSGTLGDPRAIGQLTVDAGKVLFPFATFDVQTGTVRISEADPNTLRLNVNAAARRHGYELRMEADGTLDAPRLTFSSNPPLEAADVLLMVTTGQPPADDTSNMTGQQRLTRLGTYIGRGIFKNFGGTGSEDRLEITSGEDVSREGRETYQAEYKLNERLSLTGEYDQYDAYNAGIKYRLYVQEEPRRERRRK